MTETEKRTPEAEADYDPFTSFPFCPFERTRHCLRECEYGYGSPCARAALAKAKQP